MTPMQIERARAARPQSNSMAAFYGAMAKAQGEFRSVVKDKQGHGFKYADIGDVLEMALPILSKHGLVVMQPFTDREMVTIIAHESGVEREYRVPMVTDATSRMNAAQKVGAGVTYFRRYHLCSILGIATEDEMDARLRDANAPDKNFASPKEPGLDVGVRGAKVAHDATPAQKARAYADQIILAFGEVKTAKGVNGVWTRNEAIIERLAASYPAEHGDVLEAFTRRMRAFEDDATAEPVQTMAGHP